MQQYSRIFGPPAGSYFLFGPRGTGKSWFTKKRNPDALRFDLLDPETLRDLAARPERLSEAVRSNLGITEVVIDEVQKLPELLEVVHSLIEEKIGVQFILTGSNERSLRKAGINLLGGRALQTEMHPYMACEIGSDFKLDEALEIGMVPVVRANADPLTARNSYNALYIQEEVRQEGFIRSIGDFSRFLEALSFSQGGVLNITNVARECQVPRKTVEGFLSIIEDLKLSYRVPVFDKRAKRQLAAHPKFYYFDVGVYRANRPAGPLDNTDLIPGAALETLVMQHLRAWCAYSGGKHSLSYWHTRNGLEVDAVVYGESGLFAYEIKNATKIRSEMLRGLMAFKKDYPIAKIAVLYRGQERQIIENVECIPIDEFLKTLKP